MLKAVAGGGGKGMRRVDREEDLDAAFRDALERGAARVRRRPTSMSRSSSRTRGISRSRFLGDQHGNMVHLGERECSVQRRHQKVIEESPSPLVARIPRCGQRMGEAAIQAARAAGYYNAGTVEFLADNDGNFYFLEMNTRLQVEHPVTELVTGLDLVRLQIEIAAGRAAAVHAGADRAGAAPRSSAASMRKIRRNNFFPSPGRISSWRSPRVPVCGSIPAFIPAGMCRSSTIRCWRSSSSGRTRANTPSSACCGRLSEYHVGGIKTNIPLFQVILRDPAFRRGDLHTGYLDELLKSGYRFRRRGGRRRTYEAVGAVSVAAK